MTDLNFRVLPSFKHYSNFDGECTYVDSIRVYSEWVAGWIDRYSTKDQVNLGQQGWMGASEEEGKEKLGYSAGVR